MTTETFRGTIPALMTPCDAQRRPDFDALVRKAKQLVAAGMSAVVYCGSMGDWPLLTDEERMAGVEALAKAGIPVIVGTGAQNTQRAAALASHAKRCAAAGLMIIPRVLSRGPSAAAQRAHFEAVLGAAEGLPSVIYNSPYYGFETKADLFFVLRERFAHLVGFKEFGGAESLRYAAEHITGTDPSLTLTVGVDTQVFYGFVNAARRASSRASATCFRARFCISSRCAARRKAATLRRAAVRRNWIRRSRCCRPSTRAPTSSCSTNIS